MTVKKRILSIIVLALCLLATGCGSGRSHGRGRTDSRLSVEADAETADRVTCTYDGVEHDFILELPEDTDGAPLILMLHGYGESAEVFKSRTHMEERACPMGYAVAYVTGAPDPDDRTAGAGWNSGLGDGGNDDVGFLSALAWYLQDEYGLDEKRMYAAGFSNGGFMVHRLAMEAQDTFSACVSVAGTMTDSVWESRKKSNEVGFLQITGEKDDLIPKISDGSAGSSKFPAIEDVMAYWASSNGLAGSETSPIGKASTITKYTGEDSTTQVWDIFVADGRHSWPDETLTGIDTNGVILEFLEMQ